MSLSKQGTRGRAVDWHKAIAAKPAAPEREALRVALAAIPSESRQAFATALLAYAEAVGSRGALSVSANYADLGWFLQEIAVEQK